MSQAYTILYSLQIIGLQFMAFRTLLIQSMASRMSANVPLSTNSSDAYCQAASELEAKKTINIVTHYSHCLSALNDVGSL